MIIKRMDSRQEEIAELTALLKGKLTDNQRFMIDRELKAIKSGVEGEKGLSQHAAENEVAKVEDSPFGKRYIVEGRLFGLGGKTAVVRSV